jgi:hypothetical protein
MENVPRVIKNACLRLRFLAPGMARTIKKTIHYCCEVFSASYRATSAARTTENVAPVLFERVLPNNGGFWLHSLMIWANRSRYAPIPIYFAHLPEQFVFKRTVRSVQRLHVLRQRTECNNFQERIKQNWVCKNENGEEMSSLVQWRVLPSGIYLPVVGKRKSTFRRNISSPSSESNSKPGKKPARNRQLS